MTVNPSQADPRDVYQVMIGAIVPRPIAFVSTLSAAGVPNLAPFSFFTAVSANPPVICFSPMNRGPAASPKDTLVNIEATGEFVVNVVSAGMARQMNVTSGEYGPEVDEFALSGLTPLASELVRPARVKESRIQMECRLTQVVRVSSRPLGGSLVLGEVLLFHVADEVIQGHAIDPDRLEAIGRMGGAAYTRTADRFEMPRPPKL